MSVSTTAPPAASGVSSLRRLTATEFKLFLRDRVGPVWGIGFPLGLLIIVGSVPVFRRPMKELGGLTEMDLYVPILVAFVLAMLSLTPLPLVLAAYRERGVLRRLRTTPVGPVRVLVAQLIVNATVTVITVALILMVARLAYHVVLPRQFVGFILSALLAAAAMMSIGLFLAAVVPSAKAAQAAGTTLFFPMMFFAGLWWPTALMPSVLRHISHATPLGAAVQAFGDTSQGHWPHPTNLMTLAAYTVAFGLAATKMFRWE
jgi:ABC-2 type transport system permease protein